MGNELNYRVLNGISLGQTNYEIAEDLNISYGYVKKIIRDLFKTYNVKTRTELAVVSRIEGCNEDSN